MNNFFFSWLLYIKKKLRYICARCEWLPLKWIYINTHCAGCTKCNNKILYRVIWNNREFLNTSLNQVNNFREFKIFFCFSFYLIALKSNRSYSMIYKFAYETYEVIIKKKKVTYNSKNTFENRIVTIYYIVFIISRRFVL